MSNSIIGQTAPDFTLQSSDGSMFDSKSLHAQWRVLFFYSKHNSPTCKRGCLTFKEQYELFKTAGCSIVGIGPGTLEHLRDFKTTLGDLPFPLLVDVDREIGSAYNVPLHLGQFPSKSSFVIGPDNKVHYVYDWLFRPRKHVAKVLSVISMVTGSD
ncbi:MAG: redoxin domain-containing protein [Candidatus Poseidoniaceae archaeon]|jgi:peroxiredoxin Q/BCP|nr:redoxin domain-containing protein [Candidatus Poseidoniaceae archaeon]